MQTKLITFIVTIIVISLYGCALRHEVLPNFKAGQAVFNLYNRNFIVSMPTEVGNVACALPIVLPILPIAPFIRGPSIVFEGYTYAANILVLSCGAITGITFIPFSFICPENPWYIGSGKSGPYQEWRCAKPMAGKFSLKTKPEQIINSKIDLQN